MKLSEAIEIISDGAYNRSYSFDEKFYTALKLLVAAGRREIANRENPDYVVVGKLRGETPE